jgi:CRISPR-associated protein Csx17
MPQNTTSLPVLRLAGLHLDTLGNYFAALGLLRLAAQNWPSVKGCWRDGVFHLVGGPQNFTELETFLLDIGANNKWTQYTQDWSDVQKKDTKDKTAENISQWRARANEMDAMFILSHIATAERLSFNPVFGTGGNAGKRNFSNGWKKAKDTVFIEPNPRPGRRRIIAAAKTDLPAFLSGKTCSLLGDYGAACWFGDANKKYNFSPDKPFRQGQITPWAMLLACEAFPLLVGATSRRLGSAREGTGAFPFVTKGTAPENEKEVEVLTGEFWAPVWKNPLSVAEVSALYKRGRAEANGRGAITSSAFAVAIIQRGTDAGLAEFRRFSLLRTTSAQTFESRLASIHPLLAKDDFARTNAISRVIRFRDALPCEFKKGKRWVFRGLQGPIDNALVRLAATGNDDSQRENARALLDAVFASLERTANNKNYREREPPLELLPVSWAVALLSSEREITPEIRIALAFATLRAETKEKTTTATIDSGDSAKKYDALAPFAAYRAGVVPAWKDNWSRVKIAKNTPLRVVWSERNLAANLCALARRRIIESDAFAPPPFNAQFTLPIADIFAFLNNETDDALLSRWLDRFSLFDWSFIAPEEREKLRVILSNSVNGIHAAPRAAGLLYAFFRPLFHEYTFSEIQKQSKDTLETKKKPTAGMLRPLLALLENGDTTAARAAAVNRYKSLLLPTANFGQNTFSISDPQRLLAELLLPASPAAVAKLFSHWTLPPKNKQ